jgi:hypothetical protein
MNTNNNIRRRTGAKAGLSVNVLLAALFILQSPLYTSCTREDDIETVMEKYDPENAYGTYDEAHWRRVHAAQRQAYIGDLYRSYGVGYGYNGTGKYSNYDEVRDRIIDLSAIQKYDEAHGSTTLVDDVSPSSYHHVYSGTDAITICEKLTRKSSVKVDLLLFQAEVSTTFNKTDMVSNEFAFCTIYDGLTMASRHMEPYDLYHIAHEHPEVLSPGFLRYQNLAAEALRNHNTTEAMRIIQNMFQTYGTHVIYHAQLGGKLKFSTTMNRHVVDSRNTVDQQAGVSFLYAIGTKDGTEKQKWVVDTKEDRETHIEALGGNSALALELAGQHESSDMAKKSKVIDKWFKSLKFDPSLPKDSSNVELIEIKVAPVADLIIDESVAALYNTLVGKHVAYETAVMPRVRNKVYAKIPTSTLQLVDRSVTKQVVADREIIGEVLNETVHNVDYTVFYPTLGGKMAREGLGRRCSDDSLFTITWQYIEGRESEAKAFVTPLVKLNYDDNIYYNNGVIDIAPEDSVKSYTSDISVNTAALYMWNDTCITNVKIGPYYLHQGVMANISEDQSAMNTIRTLLKDVPVGYMVTDSVKVSEVLNFLYKSGEVLAPDQMKKNDVTPFFKNKRFIMLSNNDNQYRIFWLDPNIKTHVTPMPLDLIGQALLIRRKDFKHM